MSRIVAPTIPADFGQFPAQPLGFESLVHQAIGTELTDSDGWTGALGDILTAVADDQKALAAWDGLIAAADFAAGELASSDLDALATLFAAWTATGDGLLLDLAGALQGVS